MRGEKKTSSDDDRLVLVESDGNRYLPTEKRADSQRWRQL